MIKHNSAKPNTNKNKLIAMGPKTSQNQASETVAKKKEP